ncbi:MAG TPA: hypothetical protein VG206_02870 [Terriglobia bacterium]|nr:hypothetical protein [Terriglobia bacterium]
MKFQFLDKERELKYSFGDLRRLGEKLKRFERMPLAELPHVVATALKREDPNMTPAKAAEIIDTERLDDLCAALARAAGVSKPEETVRPTPESLESAGPSPATISGSPNANSGN